MYPSMCGYKPRVILSTLSWSACSIASTTCYTSASVYTCCWLQPLCIYTHSTCTSASVCLVTRGPSWLLHTDVCRLLGLVGSSMSASSWKRRACLGLGLWALCPRHLERGRVCCKFGRCTRGVEFSVICLGGKFSVVIVFTLELSWTYYGLYCYPHICDHLWEKGPLILSIK